MKIPYYIAIITVVLIGLFFFTGMEKIWYHQAFAIKLGRQPLPEWIKGVLKWGLPLAELTVVGLLAARRTRCLGLWACALMMLCFAGYTAYAATEPTGHVPCACGKVFNMLTWGQHFWVNLGFVALAAIGICLCLHAQKNEKTAMKKTTTKILRNRLADHLAPHETVPAAPLVERCLPKTYGVSYRHQAH